MSDKPPVRSRSRPSPEAPRRALDLTVHEGTVNVQRVQYGQTIEEKQTVRVPLFSTDPAEIEVSGGISRELYDRTWVKVGVAVRMPCYPEKSEMERAAAFASDFVEALLEREMINAGLAEPAAPPAS